MVKNTPPETDQLDVEIGMAYDALFKDMKGGDTLAFFFLAHGVIFILFKTGSFVLCA